MLVLRMKYPIQVMRGSRFILNVMPWSPCWFSASSLARTASASTTMERNLGKRKGLPHFPTRICQNRIGPPSVSLMSSPTTSRKGEASKSKELATSKSIIRLTRLPPVRDKRSSRKRVRSQASLRGDMSSRCCSARKAWSSSGRGGPLSELGGAFMVLYLKCRT